MEIESSIKKLISVTGLSVSYKDIEVLSGVDLEVGVGEFVVIVGESGCGKSTLLHATAKFIPSKGEIRVPESIGMVFQNHGVFPWMTVEKNIAFGLKNFSRSDKRETVGKHVQLVGLNGHEKKFPSQLSGGQVQRVAFARAIAAQPDVVFMDEPFGALDMFTRTRMQDWLINVWGQNKTTVLFVTHNLDEALYLGSRCIVMGKGKINGDFPIEFDAKRSDELKFSDKFAFYRRKVMSLMEGKDFD